MSEDMKRAMSKLHVTLANRGRAHDFATLTKLLRLRVSLQGAREVLGEYDHPKSVAECLDRAMEELGELEFVTEANLWENAGDVFSVLAEANAVAGRVVEVDVETHKQNDPEVRQAVLDITGGKCAYCGCELQSERNGSDNFVVEHVVPKSKGGPDNIVNFVPSCRGCNNAKSDRHVYHFISNVLPYRMAKAGGAS